MSGAGAHSGPSPSANGRDEAGLPRILGAAGVVLYTAGFTIGSGIFRVPAIMARAAGSAGWLNVLWGVGFVFAASSTLFFIELATRLPRSGGKVVYLNEAFGPGAAFVYGVSGVVFLPAAAAAVARTFADYLGSVLPLSEWELRGVAALILAAHTLAAMRSTRLATGLLNAATIGKIAALIAVLLVCFAHVNPVGATMPSATTTPAFSALLLGVIPVVWAFQGSEAAIWVAGEVRDPERNVPRGMIGGLLVVTVLYVLLSAGFVKVLGLAGVAASPAVAADAVRRALGSAGAVVIATVVMTATFATNGAQVLGFSRQYYALAEDGLFPRAFARLHPRWRTPWLAVVLIGAGAIALVCAGNFQTLIRLNFLAAYPFYALTAFAAVALRARHGSPAGYRMPLYPLPVVVFAVITAAVWTAGVVDTPWLAAIAVGSIGAGGVLYTAWRPRTVA